MPTCLNCDIRIESYNEDYCEGCAEQNAWDDLQAAHQTADPNEED